MAESFFEATKLLLELRLGTAFLEILRVQAECILDLRGEEIFEGGNISVKEDSSTADFQHSKYIVRLGWCISAISASPKKRLCFASLIKLFSVRLATKGLLLSGYP